MTKLERRIMGHALKLTAVFFALLIATGCTRQTEWTGDPRLVMPEVQEVVAQIHDLTNRLSTIEVDGVFTWQDQVTNAISAITNFTERVALLDELTDCLLALDVSTLTYRRQLQALKTILESVQSMSMGRFIPDPTTQRYELTSDGTFTIRKFHFNALRTAYGETAIWHD